MRRNSLVLAASLVACQAMASAQANDSCLIGRWEPQGNAMADWVKKQNPQMAMHFKQQQALLRFNANGSYSAEMAGQAKASQGGVAANMQGNFGGSGRWTTQAGKLTLTQTQDKNTGQMEVKGPGGISSKIKLPKNMRGGPQTWAYRCKGNKMETHITVPGSKDVVIQPYLRK